MSRDGLEAAAILSAMPAKARTRIAALETLDAIDSTNSELLRRETPQSGCAVLFAETQSAGRGRQGRSWSSPPGGNLYASFARRFDGGLARLSGLSLAIGIAAAETLRALGAEPVRLKWPNDLVIVDDGNTPLRKLGGVLIECGTQGTAIRAVAGIGINLRMPAEAAGAIDQPWIDLHALLGARMPARVRIAAALTTAVSTAFERFDAEGLAPLLDRYAALDALCGRDIEAEVGGAMRRGIGAGIAADGALRLRDATGEIALQAGEVRIRARPARATTVAGPRTETPR